MKKIFFSIISLFMLNLISCFYEDPLSTGLDFNISSQNAQVGEQIELVGEMIKIFRNKETNFIFYIEDYPEKYNIIQGDINKDLTNEKYLCITPEFVKGTKGIVKLNISFDSPGEYVIKANGFFNYNNKIDYIFNQEYFTYKIIVTE